MYKFICEDDEIGVRVLIAHGGEEMLPDVLNGFINFCNAVGFGGVEDAVIDKAHELEEEMHQRAQSYLVAPDKGEQDGTE